jgi:diguanylate cyclase (GGDEF)-like protein
VEAKTPVLTERGDGSSAGKLAREVSVLQAALLGKLHAEFGPGGDSALFASAAQRLAEEFGSVTATAIGTLWERQSPRAEPGPDGAALPGLHQPGQMRRRLDQLIATRGRYGHPFGLVVFDVDGPGARNDDRDGDQDPALAVVGAALHDSVRLIDETYWLGAEGICVLAPNQTTVGGLRMAERLLQLLDELEAAGGLRIGITAGVVACPEHGDDAEALLHRADEAMWRARAVGQPVGVGPLEA